MRRLALAAAFALTPALASAQSPADSRTFAGCDIYACATFTVRYTTATVRGEAGYVVTGDGTFTLLAPIVTGAYSMVPIPTLEGRLFSGRDYEDANYLSPIFLVGHAAGDVIPLVLDTGPSGLPTLTQPVLDLSRLRGTIIGPDFPATRGQLDITLSAVPEPGTLALAAAGLALVGGIVRRRRIAAA